MRTITVDTFITVKDSTTILDVRREQDYQQSSDTLPGATWKDPALIEDWVAEVPKDKKVVVFCVRGGSVSNSVLDRLLAEGIDASFIEGGIEAVKATGATVSKA